MFSSFSNGNEKFNHLSASTLIGSEQAVNRGEKIHAQHYLSFLFAESKSNIFCISEAEGREKMIGRWQYSVGFLEFDINLIHYFQQHKIENVHAKSTERHTFTYDWKTFMTRIGEHFYWFIKYGNVYVIGMSYTKAVVGILYCKFVHARNKKYHKDSCKHFCIF